MRSRVPSPYARSESDASGVLTDSETNISKMNNGSSHSNSNHNNSSNSQSHHSSKATAFLSNLLGRKSSTGTGLKLPSPSTSVSESR